MGTLRKGVTASIGPSPATPPLKVARFRGVVGSSAEPIGAPFEAFGLFRNIVVEGDLCTHRRWPQWGRNIFVSATPSQPGSPG
ncbi:unnamed protein product [Tuber aestivum]|uniref:Uncharacterized protein n=1 Tax=Tuber aestivum TaxID=59557 RepID=A0A292PL75_9PEZI|nr:unnamed protein product [Tuber aestivum]